MSSFKYFAYYYDYSHCSSKWRKFSRKIIIAVYIYTRKNTLWNHFNHLKTLSHTRAHLFHTDKSTFPLKNILFSNYFQLFSQTHRSSFDRSSPFILLLVPSLSLFLLISYKFNGNCGHRCQIG